MPTLAVAALIILSLFLVHEGGHALAALLLGVRIRRFTILWVSMDEADTEWKKRLVFAAGGLANGIAAYLFWRAGIPGGAFAHAFMLFSLTPLSRDGRVLFGIEP